MSKASYRLIDYSLRPAKSIERKMLAEAFRRLTFFDHVSNYRYIGFGSTYFTDFILFHRTLGIRDMISIEERVTDKPRFEFNRPFNCIKMEYENSNTVLPRLDWSKEVIIWLDYDKGLGVQKLQDIACVCAKAVSGSVLIVTVNAHPIDVLRNRDLETEEERQQFRMRKFVEGVGESRASDFSSTDLKGWNLAKTYRKVILNEVEQTLADRNGLVSVEHKKMRYQPLFNFHYSDGPKMLTVGFILYAEEDVEKVNMCDFEDPGLDFIRTGSDAYQIQVPRLTHRERRYLDKTLPLIAGEDVEEGDSETDVEEDVDIGIPPRDIEHYIRLYRYFPNFAETEL